MPNIPDAVPIEAIEVTEDNGDEVANFLDAHTYTRIRSRLLNFGTLKSADEFTTTGYMFTLMNGKAVPVEIGKTLIKPHKKYANTLFVGPQTGE